MSPEEKVLTYSLLSSLSFIIVLFAIGFSEKAIHYYENEKDKSYSEINAIKLTTNRILLSVAVIFSVVFYSLAMSEIKKIKKTNYYKASIFFLVITSIIYVLIISLLVFALKDKIERKKTFQEIKEKYQKRLQSLLSTKQKQKQE